jgi:AcrR family transcriptional regulator
VTTPRPGLRERKKQATREALREAALRLALERGPENVRVDDIAEEAGVSPRTYNNYFASRDHAIVAAVTGERDERVAAAVAARPGDEALADAVIGAVVEQYTEPAGHDPGVVLLLTSRPALRDAFLGAPAAIEHPLAVAIADRLGTPGDLDTARVLAAAVAAAVRVALERWVQPASASSGANGLVVPSGPLPELLRATLAPLRPSLDAAEISERSPASTGRGRKARNSAAGTGRLHR